MLGSSTLIADAPPWVKEEERCDELLASRQWPFHLPTKINKIKLAYCSRHMEFSEVKIVPSMDGIVERITPLTSLEAV